MEPYSLGVDQYHGKVNSFKTDSMNQIFFQIMMFISIRSKVNHQNTYNFINIKLFLKWLFLKEMMACDLKISFLLCENKLG